MEKAPKTYKKHRWYTPLLIKLGLAASYRRIPIFGVEAAGKSYFSFSLAQYLSSKGLGRPLGASSAALASVINAITARKPLPATTGNRDLCLHVQKVYTEAYSKVVEDIHFLAAGLNPVPIADLVDGDQDQFSDTLSANILISTNDMSGTQFRNAMKQIGEPHSDPQANPLVAQFLEVIQNCDGAIVVVDLVRDRARMAETEKIEMVRQSIAEQVVPLMNGINMALENRNQQNKFFPLYLVFTKKDVHGLEREALYLMVKEIFAMLLAQFSDVIKLRIHSVVNMGFIESSSYLDSDSEGISFFLADLYTCSRLM